MGGWEVKSWDFSENMKLEKYIYLKHTSDTFYAMSCIGLHLQVDVLLPPIQVSLEEKVLEEMLQENNGDSKILFLFKVNVSLCFKRFEKRVSKTIVLL